MDHSYEEIRNVVIDILLDREKVRYPPNQYEHLIAGVAEVFQRREGTTLAPSLLHHEPHPSAGDAELTREVFWDLFRQGTITLGSSDADRKFPHFKVSSLGKKILDGQNPYFFHDLESYTKLIRSNVPAINDITLLYLQEAMQSFRSGCMLAATVMLGVASEHSFLLLVEAAENSPKYGSHFGNVAKERTMFQKFKKFRLAVDKQVKADLPSGIKETLDIEFDGILNLIRTFRNESGHPSGTILGREQTYVLLQMFIPYCKAIYQLMDFLR
jgi:hypothetical protein